MASSTSSGKFLNACPVALARWVEQQAGGPENLPSFLTNAKLPRSTFDTWRSGERRTTTSAFLPFAKALSFDVEVIVRRVGELKPWSSCCKADPRRACDFRKPVKRSPSPGAREPSPPLSAELDEDRHLGQGVADSIARVRREIIDFSAERNRHKHFFGRQDVLAEMDAWANQREGGWLLITGCPGLGKSALMDRWLRQRTAASLTAFHFIRRSTHDWDKPQVVQRNLAAQIEVMFPKQRDPHADPEYRLEQLLGRVNPVLAERDQRLMLLVDGLDEAMPLGKNNPIPYIFPHELPTRVFVVTASRSRYPHLNWFDRRTGPTTRIDLDERVASNEQAVCEYWQRLGATMEPPLSEELVHVAIRAAEGNLLHAVKLFELWSRPNAKRSPRDVPQGFEGMLEELWERTGALPKDAKKRVRDGLSLVSAARESLPLRVLDELLGWDEGEAEDELLPLAREMLLEEPWHEERAYRPFHEGFRELIERKQPRAIREHHRVLSEYAAWPIGGDTFRRSYALRHRVEHRVESGQVDAAAKTCLDVGYLTAKACAEGVVAVERDIRLAAEACGVGETRRRLMTLARLVAANSHWANDVPESLPALLHDRALTNAPELLGDMASFAHVLPRHPRLRHPLQIRGMSRILHGHSRPVLALAVLPEGGVVSASHDTTVRVWDVKTGRTLVTLEGHTKWVNALAVLPDGRIVSGSHDETVRVWDVTTGRALATLECLENWVNALVVLPDRRVVSASADNLLRVWDLQSGQAVAVLRGHSKSVSALVALPDGCVVSGSHDKTLRVWDLQTERALATLEGHTGPVNALAVLPDGCVVSGSSDNTLRVWDVQAGRALATLQGHTSSVNALAVLPDGRIVSGSHDTTVRVWEVQKERSFATLQGHTSSVKTLAVLPDGRVVSGLDDSTVRVWDVQTEQSLPSIQGHTSAVKALAVLPDGNVVSGSDDTTLRVWDVKTGRALATLERHASGVNALAVLPDGRVVSGSDDKTVRVWDVQTRRVITTLDAYPNWVKALVVLPDGRVVSGSIDETVRVWDVKTGRTVATLEGHTGSVNALAVLPEGHVVSGSDDMTVRVWDVKTGRAVATLEGHWAGALAVAVLPHGRVVFGSYDMTLRVWDVQTGRAVSVLEGHQGWVRALAVLPDGRVTSGSDDRTLRVWDLETGRTVATVYGDASFTSVTCVDQHLIVAGDAAGNVWFIDLPELPQA